MSAQTAKTSAFWVVFWWLGLALLCLCDRTIEGAIEILMEQNEAGSLGDLLLLKADELLVREGAVFVPSGSCARAGW